MKLKVISWNIWIDGNFKEVVDFLRNSQADIIGLQEVVDDDRSRDIIKALKNEGYNSYFGSAEHTWDGNVYKDGPAILTKYKIIKNETHTLSEKDKRVAVQADIVAGNKTLHIFSTHLIHTHQKKGEEQDIQVSNLIKILPSERTILMGDFNAIPESSVIRNVNKVLVDADPDSYPTWSIYPEGCLVCNPQTMDTRLDYIFTSKDLKASSYKVEDSKASDHLPISVIIEI